MADSRLQESDPALAEIDRLLAEIGPDASTTATPRTGPLFLAPDPNDPDIIIHEVKLTRYDKAIHKLRDLEAKRATLLADHDPRKVALLDHQITNARKAVTAAQDDLARLRDKIDEWRAGAGREVYNAARRAKRRKVRANPNADLSDMTPEQRKQRMQDQTTDKKWIDRRRAAGIPEAQIQAALVVRIREREAKRKASAQDGIEQAALEALPGYGIV